MNVVFCANPGMLMGLHSALSSMLRCCSRRKDLIVHLFLEGVSEAERQVLRGIGDKWGGSNLVFHAADYSMFSDLPALLGDRMTYQRLSLADTLASVETLLYLDADLVFNGFDVCRFFDFTLGDTPLGASGLGRVKSDYDSAFFRGIGYGDDETCFNAGVLLINAKLWREENLLRQILDFGRLHGAAITCCDQTILNSLYMRSFAHLSPEMNTLVFAEDSRGDEDFSGSVIHFVGSPKPWDFFGKQVHAKYQLWKEAAGDHFRRNGAYSIGNMKTLLSREWKIRRSYARIIKRRIGR